MKGLKKDRFSKCRTYLFYPVFFLYFFFVASPPRICLSALFSLSIVLACCASWGFIFRSRSVTSLCTVDLDIPNFFAVSLTVALLFMMYSASSMVLSSMYAFNWAAPFYIVLLCTYICVNEEEYYRIEKADGTITNLRRYSKVGLKH